MNEATVAIIFSILSIGLTVIGLLIQRFVFDAKIQARLAELEVKTNLFWNIVEKEIPRIIHSPHTPDIDILLDKLMASTINRDELHELKCVLKERIYDEPDKTKMLAGILLLGVLEQKERELCR